MSIIPLISDTNIQIIAEKYLEEACIDNVCTDGGSIIMMNPKNGDILAMATYPNYDLNNPYELEIIGQGNYSNINIIGYTGINLFIKTLKK